MSGRVLDEEEIRGLLDQSRRIAVLGIKPETHADRPAHFVPAYLASVGYEIIPVPVYYPEIETILGKRVYRSLATVPGSVDIVDVFRRPEHLMPHLGDLLACRPRAVWLQSGIRHAALVERLVAEGIDVVQDRCMLVDHRSFGVDARSRKQV